MENPDWKHRYADKITTKFSNPGPEIKVQVEENEKHVKVSVRDHGIGGPIYLQKKQRLPRKCTYRR